MAVVHVHLEVDVRQLVGPPEGVGAAQPGGVDEGQREQRSAQHLDDLRAPHGNLLDPEHYYGANDGRRGARCGEER